MTADKTSCVAETRLALIVSDNRAIINGLTQIVADQGFGDRVEICCSPRAPALVRAIPGILEIDVKERASDISGRFSLVISAHCKQLFPSALVQSVDCINIHPGYNPETRGWFPQVWAILHGLRAGFTVHRIDEQLDHGDIIYREEQPVHSWDTSASVYGRVLQAELDWLAKNLHVLLDGGYSARAMETEGQLFLKRDFDALLELDLQHTATLGDLLNRLRALTFAGYRNAYYIDSHSGKRVYVSVQLDPE